MIVCPSQAFISLAHLMLMLQADLEKRSYLTMELVFFFWYGTSAVASTHQFISLSLSVSVGSFPKRVIDNPSSMRSDVPEVVPNGLSGQLRSVLNAE